MAEKLGEKEYSQSIVELSKEIKASPIRKEEFLSSVKEIGLFFEAPNFTSFESSNFIKVVKDLFNISPNEPILIRKELLQYMKEKMNLDTHVPNHNIIINDIFAAPIYTLKLKQEASLRITSRDFGDYKATTKQPSQGRNKDGIVAQSSRIGHMELNNELLHTVMYVEKFREFRGSLSEKSYGDPEPSLFYQ